MNRIRARKTHPDRYFFIASGIWYVLIIFFGFAPSFYLVTYFEDFETPTFHLQLHGVVYTVWVLLYLVQTILIAKRNMKLHISLGFFGILVILLMIPTGFFPSLYKVYVGSATITGGGHNVFRLLFAYVFFFVAFYHRRNAFVHKRFMLSCMVMLMGAAVFRILADLDLLNSQILYKGLQIFPALALFAYDLIVHKKAVWIDLVSVVAVLGIFFFASSFWLSPTGNKTMKVLISVFVKPFL